MKTRTLLTFTAVAGIAATPNVASASPANYEFEFQEPAGRPAEFIVYGSATEGDLEGDAYLWGVSMPNGRIYSRFYTPTSVSQLWYDGDGSHFRIRGGENLYDQNLRGTLPIADAVNDGSGVSNADIETFQEKIRQAFASKNLNVYLDGNSNVGDWECIIEFDKEVLDNDPDPDEVGELLYFERGSDYGNSWLGIQAIDDDGNALGPILALSPDETLATTPAFASWRDDQGIGAVAIDVSRLGVSSFKRLKLLRLETGQGGYTSGEVNADFKFMAIITHPAHMPGGRHLRD